MNEQKTALFRFYEELNDFLPEEKRKHTFPMNFVGTPAIKDTIEAIGVPHSEIDLIIVNGQSVDFNYQLQANDQVSVYPIFESLDITPIVHLRAKPLRHTRFVLDVHLGKLARNLRLLGFDVLYKNNYSDQEIIDNAHEQHAIILTRDRNLLKQSKVTHGYWLRHTDPMQQIQEIVQRFDLKNEFKPLTRCLTCNGMIKQVDKKQIEAFIPKKTREFIDEFYQCQSCKKIYWEGAHFPNIQALIDSFNNL